MKIKNTPYLSLTIWILSIITIGGLIGSLTKPQISTWYITLNRAPLTPPNYIFSVAWTLLYAMIGTCGWLIWRKDSFAWLKVIKTIFVTQLILNWIWTPVFFYYHLPNVSLLILCAMDILVGIIICQAYLTKRAVFFLLIPYFLWILFATYLNFYIWWFN